MEKNQSYAAWMAAVDRSVDTQYRKLKKRRVDQGKPIAVDANIAQDLALMRHKRVVALTGDAMRLLVAADDIVSVSLPSQREFAKVLIRLIAHMRESSSTAHSLARRLQLSDFQE